MHSFVTTTLRGCQTLIKNRQLQESQKKLRNVLRSIKEILPVQQNVHFLFKKQGANIGYAFYY